MGRSLDTGMGISKLKIDHGGGKHSRSGGGVWQVDEDFGAFFGLGMDFDFAAVFADDAADDEQAESAAGRFGGAVGLEEAAHVFGWDAGAVVGNGDEEIGFGGLGFDFYETVIAGDGLVGVAEEVVENLLKLVWVDNGFREVFGKFEIDGYSAGSDFGFEEFEGLVEDRVEIVRCADGCAGADGVEELLEDGIEPADFVACGFEVFGEVVAVGGWEFSDFAVEELEVDIE